MSVFLYYFTCTFLLLNRQREVRVQHEGDAGVLPGRLVEILLEISLDLGRCGEAMLIVT